MERIVDVDHKGKAIVLRSVSGPEKTTIRMSETPDDSERASVVIFESGETSDAILEGFTLTGGRGTKWGGGSWKEEGGGILCINDSSPTLRDCTITGNTAGREK